MLITGNGFFKPNISTMVGQLYPPGSVKRDGGFTIFYMGINLGAAMSPLVCGYVGETYGWHYGFGLATIGMLIWCRGFRRPYPADAAADPRRRADDRRLSLLFLQNNAYSLAINVFVGASLGRCRRRRLRRARTRRSAGRRGPAASVCPGQASWPVYMGALVALPVFMLLVQRNVRRRTRLLSLFGGAAFAWLLVEAPGARRSSANGCSSCSF